MSTPWKQILILWNYFFNVFYLTITVSIIWTSNQVFFIFEKIHKEQKKKIDKLDIIKVKTFVLQRTTSGEGEKQHTKWETIFKNYVSLKGLVSKISTELLQLNAKKTTQLKNGRRIWIDVSPDKTIQMANEHEKVFSITSRQGTVNQNLSEIPPHTQNDSNQKVSNKCWRGWGETGSLMCGCS